MIVVEEESRRLRIVAQIADLGPKFRQTSAPNCRSGFAPRCLAKIARFPTEVSNPINNHRPDPVRPSPYVSEKIDS